MNEGLDKPEGSCLTSGATGRAHRPSRIVLALLAVPPPPAAFSVLRLQRAPLQGPSHYQSGILGGNSNNKWQESLTGSLDRWRQMQCIPRQPGFRCLTLLNACDSDVWIHAQNVVSRESVQKCTFPNSIAERMVIHATEKALFRVHYMN